MARLMAIIPTPSSFSVWFLKSAVFTGIMSIALLCALIWGVEEKSWLERSWVLLSGGTLGVLAGIGFFLAFGAIGFVSAAGYGAVGLFSLLFGGGLGGLGLGSVANMLANPAHYDYNGPVLITVLGLGLFAAQRAAAWAGRWYEKGLSTTSLPPNAGM